MYHVPAHVSEEYLLDNRKKIILFLIHPAAIEGTINQLKQVSLSNVSAQGTANQNQIFQQSQQATSQLQQQIQSFENQTQQQKQQADPQLRSTIQTAISALAQANQQIQTHQV